MQNTGKTFSIYTIEEKITIENLYKKFVVNKQTSIIESQETYITEIISKSSINICFKRENTYFSISLKIERPKMNGGKSKKEVEILFCYNKINKKLLAIPIITDLQAHIIMRNLNGYFKAEFYNIIPKSKKDLFVSWLYRKEKTALKENEIFLKKIKAYKCATDDNIGHFRGKSESTIADYIETMQIIISGYDMGYLKLSVAYTQAIACDFVLGFYENYNFKVHYTDAILGDNLFKEKITPFEFIIFIVNLMIPKMYSIFLEENWTEEDMLNLRLELSDIVIQQTNEKKEIILKRLEEIKKEDKKSSFINE